MKSLIQFCLLLALVIIGKITKEQANTRIATATPRQQVDSLRSFFARQVQYTRSGEQQRAASSANRAAVVSLN